MLGDFKPVSFYQNLFKILIKSHQCDQPTFVYICHFGPIQKSSPVTIKCLIIIKKIKTRQTSTDIWSAAKINNNTGNKEKDGTVLTFQLELRVSVGYGGDRNALLLQMGSEDLILILYVFKLLPHAVQIHVQPLIFLQHVWQASVVRS